MTAPVTEPIPAERLRAFEGQPAGPAMEAPDPVNQAMIRHWVEAMGDENPVYVDEQAARGAGFPGVVAPATMLQAWTMRGYRRSMDAERTRRRAGGPSSALDALFAVLDEAGFTSVVATDCEQEYRRPLVLGDRLRAESVIESVSPEKRTALGQGHFVTTRTDFVAGSDEVVATMRFRILRFRPLAAPVSSGPAAGPAADPAAGPAPQRPRPAITADNAFFFEGARRGVLLVQRCSGCGRLRHPPGPACPWCRSLEWQPVESSGRGQVFSYVVIHHPQVPAFEYPLVVALVELEEGIRLVADLVGAEPSAIHVGMPVVTELVAVDDELTIPMFRPASGVAARD
jgi:3-oxo-4,17-pregnadiene-20-carboxyl-CoA hydratase alpha subunit